jgi:hypothetical protein
MPAVSVTNLYPTPTNGATDQRLTVDGTVGGVQFASTFSTSSRYVVLDVQDADVMVTFDGSAPTSTNGHRLPAFTSYTWHVNTARVAKFIRATATSGVVHASEFTD